ncbi:hypothetical protein [Bacillus sp. FJAT-29937]|uniref:hypothetical protein n=1 Tax=Bacillus sp. FJAT-29937 TaxID=1720553 RepID=UPI000AC04F6E|nr:hypothetical protein [Bacillus sp. FJAT-29937]
MKNKHIRKDDQAQLAFQKKIIREEYAQSIKLNTNVKKKNPLYSPKRITDLNPLED